MRHHEQHIVILATVTALVLSAWGGAHAATEATITVTVTFSGDSVDSDGDGLSDDYETGILGSNPNDTDTDDDGFSDYDEDRAGTDATNPNSYPPSKWVQFSYRGTENGTLTQPFNTVAEGAAAAGSAGVALMFLGTLPYNASYEHPRLDQPMRVGTRDGAVRIGLINLDSDGDGLPDADEATIHGTNPYDSDTDGDGLDDYAEVITLGTNPNSTDTDGDGWSDFDEVKYGSDPTDINDVVVDIWVDFAWNGPTTGSETQPFNTLADGQTALISGGTIGIKGDSAVVVTQELLRLTKPMRVLAFRGFIRVTGDAAPPLPGEISLLPTADPPGTSLVNGNMPALHDLLLQLATTLFNRLGNGHDNAMPDLEAPRYEPAVPVGANADGLRIAHGDTPLAIRLRNPDGIDPSSIELPLQGDGQDGGHATWRPAVSGTDDIWVILEPEEYWHEKDVVTVTVRAATTEGTPIGPVTYRFIITDTPVPSDSPAETDQQPGPAIDHGALYSESTGTAHLVPLDPFEGSVELSNGIGPVYAIRPDVLYDAPQRVWVPVPESLTPDDVEVFCYLQQGTGNRWCPGETVEGWLVAESTLHLNLGAEDQSYIGLLVRHPAIIQLGYHEAR